MSALQSAIGNQKSAIGEAPPRNGWINTYYRYYKGRKLGPYYVRRWKENGKVHREYIKHKDVEKVRAACQEYREMEEAMEEAVRSNNRFIHNFGFYVRLIIRMRRGKNICRPHAEFYHRLWTEGFRIRGCPSMRRKITRLVLNIDGKQVVLQTVHEIDGTKTVSTIPISSVIGNRKFAVENPFMVPVSAKNQIEPKTVCKTTFEQQFLDLYIAIFGHTPTVTA